MAREKFVRLSEDEYAVLEQLKDDIHDDRDADDVAFGEVIAALAGFWCRYH